MTILCFLHFLQKKIKIFCTRYKKYVSSAVLLLGFVVDNFTFTRIDLWFDNLVLFFYLILVALGIIFINLHNEGILKSKLIEKVSFWFVFLMQYAFGGLFSAFFIFYSRSGSFSTSWFFIFLLIGLMVSNELFKERYLRFEFQVSLFFLAIFSFLTFFIPVVLSVLGVEIFLLSGIVSISFMILFLWFLSLFLPILVRNTRMVLMWSIGSIYLVINIFYFTNIIPPIPLSLKDAGVYHFVERTNNGDYLARYEKIEWYEFIKKYKNKITRVKGAPIYFYSAVFSPTNLDTKIIHSWQYFDTNKKEWGEMFHLKYNIFGGRDGGYRGYSFKENITLGRWRVDVKTERNSLLGRYKFLVVDESTSLVLETHQL